MRSQYRRLYLKVMRVKKSCGKVFGADMTAAEKKAMRIEIERQMAEYNRRNLTEIDAIILWVLHAKCGFGAKRLKDFYNHFSATIDELINHYEMDESDRLWLCTEKLKGIGVDIEQWQKERNNA